MLKLKKVEKISLNGIWQLINTNRKIMIPTEVPGSVFEALIKEKKLIDPFYGNNEHEVSWVFNSNWSYETVFDVDPEFLKHQKKFLLFHGIDTISDVYLNDELLGTTENMFITYDFEVNDQIKSSKNSLRIEIKSPTVKAQNEIDKFKIPLNTFDAAIPGVPFLRKAQYSFGWDWGPQLPDIGIWKEVELIGYDEIKLDSMYIEQKFNYNVDPLSIKNPEQISEINVDSVQMDIHLDIITELKDIEKSGIQINVVLLDLGIEVISKNVPLHSKTQKLSLVIEDPRLWWTHDLGEPKLYELEVSLVNQGKIEKCTQKIGFRDIRLIRNTDRWGESFFFLLNGVPIFGKGANWIPIDSFIPRGKKNGLYQMNLNYAREANMNMLRVWGGGIYEDDLFYQLCDELGILVWQDFPFACALYNLEDEEFIKSIRLEAEQNIKRIRNHASLALWCGNNEIEVLWNRLLRNLGLIDEKDAKLWLNPDAINSFLTGYQNMFENILPDLIRKYDGKHPYWPSSPSNGIGKKRGALVSNSPDEGDSHFWTIWHGRAPFQEFRNFNSRFMSEFGFESFPSLKTIKTFCPPEQFDIYSEIMENHQKNRAGNRLIMNYMKKRFSAPKMFESQIILSQITQGEAMEYGIEHWRRNRKEQHCMGSLYWQLNDCWPVASWASLDYYGRWKALQYFAKRVYQPFFASVKEDRENCELWITNDHKIPKKAEFYWRIINSKGKDLDSGKKVLDIPPCTSILAEKIDMNAFNSVNLDQIVIFFTLNDVEEDQSLTFHGFRLFGVPKDFILEKPNLKYKFSRLNNTENNDWHYEVEINSEKIALYLFLESEILDFICSDNFFLLPPNETRKIKIRIVNSGKNQKKIELEDLIEKIKISSLFDLIQH